MDLKFDVRSDEVPPALLKFSEIDEARYAEYISEWEQTGEVIVPSATKRAGRSFGELMGKWTEDETDMAGGRGFFVPATLYFLQGTGGRLLGSIHFRHYLNDRIRANGGHIGYGIRPSERNKGYAKVMLRLLLEELKDRDVARVLITCDDDNKPSLRTIEKCGGVLGDKIVFEDVLTRRYWITLCETDQFGTHSAE